MEHYGGAKCLVVRKNKILLVKHKHNNREYFTLPGGGIEKGETPETAAIRELHEECAVHGTIINKVSEYLLPEFMPDGDGRAKLYTFHMDIGDQDPKLGYDPEHLGSEQILVELRWLALNEICERDKTFYGHRDCNVYRSLAKNYYRGVMI